MGRGVERERVRDREKGEKAREKGGCSCARTTIAIELYLCPTILLPIPIKLCQLPHVLITNQLFARSFPRSFLLLSYSPCPLRIKKGYLEPFGSDLS